MPEHSSARGSKRREQIDCFNCTASRRQCDRTRHRCETCSRCSEACGGYPRDWSWQPGVKSRGKHQGRSMSIVASSQEWQSITPINHMFVFKQGNPLRKQNRRGAKSTRSKSSNNSKTSPFTPSGTTTLNSQVDLHPSDFAGLEVPSSTSVVVEDTSSQDTISTAEEEINDLATLENADSTLENLDFLLMHDFDEANNAIMMMPRISPDSLWSDQSSSWHLSTSGSPPSPQLLPSSPVSALETPEIYTLFNTELCLLPLTYDFDANPIRCASRSSEHTADHTVYAILAFSMQYLSRASAVPSEDSTWQQIAAYRHSATQLCASASPSATRQLNEHVLDTTVILFNFDSMTSAVGPWNQRLAAALQRIESIGGISALSTSPRFRAQLAMFLWWDCNISLFTRSRPTFPSCYYDFVLPHGNEEAADIYALTGVSNELFSYFRELAELASEKELVSKLKYARFDNTRVLEIERRIRNIAIDEFEPGNAAEGEESIQTWYDYYNGIKAWKYGILLYIARVLKWDGTEDPNQTEMLTLSRLVLDSVRCCRADSIIRKQFVHPVFLAGSESKDSYSRKFVIEYFDEWRSWTQYAMFKDALDLLREIWDERDKCSNDSRVWWGSVIRRRSPDTSEFLLG